MRHSLKAVLCLTLSLPLCAGEAAAQLAAVKIAPASASAGAAAASSGALAPAAPGLLSRAALGLGAALLAVCTGCGVLGAPALSEDAEVAMRLNRLEYERDRARRPDEDEYHRVERYNSVVYETFLSELKRGRIKSESQVDHFVDALIDKDLHGAWGRASGDYGPWKWGVMGEPSQGWINTKLRVKQAIRAAWSAHMAEIEAARSARVLSDPRLGR